MAIEVVVVKKGRNNIGTNFYWFKEEQKEDFEHHEGLHIGKRSCGWVFHFQAHHEPFLHSFNDYKKFLKQGYIYDEYENAAEKVERRHKGDDLFRDGCKAGNTADKHEARNQCDEGARYDHNGVKLHSEKGEVRIYAKL